jgi:UDP-glucose:(heptosyl)LPS alpha-1,3-glucosyltransferase
VKVALIVEWLDAWRGGAETSTGQFIDELLALGVEVTAITRSHVTARPGLAVVTLKSNGPLRGPRTLRFCEQADRVAGAGDFDVVHALAPSQVADVYQPRGGTYAETMARNRALRRSQPGRALKRFGQRFNVKQRGLLRREADMLTGVRPPVVLALSDYVVEQLRMHYGLDAGRIVKIFNGVTPDDTDPQERERQRREIRELYQVADDERLALSVAHNFRLKGVGTWIDALSLLRRGGDLDGLKVLIVGKERSVPWQNRVARRGLRDVVQFVGPVQQVDHFYHAADFLVHPTFYDPCSRVVLEAQAARLPCITTRFDGAAEAITDGVNGFVLDAPDDPRILADRVRQLAEGETLARMRRAVRDAPVWDMQRHTQQVLDVYSAIRAEKGKR